MSNTNNSDDPPAFAIGMLVGGVTIAVMLLMLNWIVGEPYVRGAMDHADGKVVVRTLPDGVRKVYYTKDLKEGPATPEK